MTGPATVSVDEAARLLGIGRSLARDLARRGEFPVQIIRLGRLYRVPRVPLLVLLGLPVGGDQ
ncbi:MAG: helix-turn-helix domain-containing protein [Actinomycetes bacterium]